jgi:protoporphyrinogen oxidase
MQHNVIILGGGISGLSLAWRLGSRGVQSRVVEMDGIVGGLAKTVREDGYCLDVGPHSFFSENAAITDIVLELFNHSLKPNTRRVKFYYRREYLDYPLTPYSVLVQMGLWSGIRAAISFAKCKLFPRTRRAAGGEDETVEDWAIGSFGKHLYRTFFKPYTEQFWKVSCSELSARSIPFHTRTRFINTLKMLFKKHVASGTSLIEREMLPTYYPPTGFGEIAERIADAALTVGAEIRLGCRAVRVDRLHGKRVRVIVESAGKQEEIEGDHVVSTIPLSRFVEMLTPAPPADVLATAKRLDHRSLVALGMVTQKQNVLNCGYIYVLNRPYNRIAEMNEFSPATSPPGENIIMVELPCLRNSAVWDASKEEIFDMCIGSLAEDGFLLPGDVTRLLLVKEPYAYPIYRRDYAPHLKRLLDYVNASPLISTLGRAGEFMYMDVDICMTRAFDFAEILLNTLDGPVRA